MEPGFISTIITDTIMKLIDAGFVIFFCRTLNIGWWVLAMIVVFYPLAKLTRLLF